MKLHPYYESRLGEHGVHPHHVAEALLNEDHRNVQPDGRIQVWGYVPEFGKYVRVILMPDGETVFNAFRDRSYSKRRGAL